MGSPVNLPLNSQAPLLCEKMFCRLVLRTIFMPASMVCFPFTQLQSSVRVLSKSEAGVNGSDWTTPRVDQPPEKETCGKRSDRKPVYGSVDWKLGTLFLYTRPSRASDTV